MKKTLAVAATLLAIAFGPALSQEKSDDKETINKAFAGMDTNKDGKIDRAELGVYMQAIIDKQREDFDAGFEEVDVNKDGKIDRQEAKANTILVTYFDALDTDKDGFLSKAEMDHALAEAAKLKN
ncbi:EF-hand domain-containing protein [Rhizobium sp. P38BS-XIX]|uniref:EF-hand domain-containing protein n=1 Tax=Rhizobium sp. P38BS-XIX TaxID=2726740 RepID=UPI00145670DB|nr:EF-hand domain-containing protein [Rhizobium sp. P38BS-XIX]NLR99929.1 EF-hand domain-containing protein [Rhizobium sp. P38BS-XIX]